MGAAERELLLDAFDSNWIAPLGEHVDAVTSYDRAVNLAEGTVAQRPLKRKLAAAQRKAKKK